MRSSIGSPRRTGRARSGRRTPRKRKTRVFCVDGETHRGHPWAAARQTRAEHQPWAGPPDGAMDAPAVPSGREIQHPPSGRLIHWLAGRTTVLPPASPPAAITLANGRHLCTRAPSFGTHRRPSCLPNKLTSQQGDCAESAGRGVEYWARGGGRPSRRAASSTHPARGPLLVPFLGAPIQPSRAMCALPKRGW